MRVRASTSSFELSCSRERLASIEIELETQLAVLDEQLHDAARAARSRRASLIVSTGTSPTLVTTRAACADADARHIQEVAGPLRFPSS